MDTALTRLAAAPFRHAGTAAGLRAADFDEIVRQHQRRIYRLLLSLVRDPDAADTLTQECFLRAYRKRASFRGEASIATWLMRIAINLATDHGKNRRRAFWSRLFGRSEASESAALDVTDPQPSAERALIASEQVAAVRAVVNELPARQRAIFLLRFVEEMSIEEIAHATGLETGTVKSHLHRALSAVRQQVKLRSST
ncbi:MAG: sigma-70 family RNA polymerase sigma factor [Acidobacteria bacterium]|nr:sigma-70 family RNA polymerase sigma factor [Acidobacteriota bacterium]MBI3663069.1 sigma-70 family RNA polymerase sigma factor [Acidobacteriota bacterium]